jgi:hypothetical protein
MNSKIVHLHKATDAEDAWAINLVGDFSGVWRAQRGFGQNFQKIWSLELQSDTEPDLAHVDWDAVLEQAILSADMNDPIVPDFHWPMKQPA